jgi:hypothetical protein
MVLWVQHCSRDLLEEMLFCCDLQVDQHVEAFKLVCMGQEDVVFAGQLARKGLKPKQFTLVGGCNDSSLSALAALLATEQGHPMFQRVQSLTLDGSLLQHLPPVSIQLPQ